MTPRTWLAVVVAALLPVIAPADPLDDAFARERALLETEREALQGELEAARARAEQRTAELRDRIAELEGTLDALRQEGDALAESMSALARDEDEGERRRHLLDSSLDHARELLSDRVRLAWTDSTPDHERIAAVMAAGLAEVDRLTSIRREPGSFFDVDGNEVGGTLVRLGPVGVLGVGSSGGGVLAPAGGGELAVVDPAGEDAARALLEGELPDLLPLHVIDPLEREVDAGNERSLRDFLAAGGVLVWPILGLGLIAVIIVAERMWTLRRVRTNAEDLMVRVTEAASRDDFEEATAICAREPGAVSRVLLAALSHRHHPKAIVEDAISESILQEVGTLERYLPTLRVIAAVTPLLGLLGTVTGMISTFEVITEFGAGNAKLLSGGISEALITTELGLAVAIPVLLVHNFLSSFVDRIVNAMEKHGLRLSITLSHASPPETVRS